MNNNKPQNVFVYGSLKKGFGNHDFVADQNFLGSAKTSSSDYMMISLGAFPAVCPYPGAYKVTGEVYEVDPYTLHALDQLEGNGRLYNREQRDFILDSGRSVKAWVYLMNINVAKQLFSKNNTRASSVQKDGDSLVWL